MAGQHEERRRAQAQTVFLLNASAFYFFLCQFQRLRTFRGEIKANV